jgi:hypothetical protein
MVDKQTHERPLNPTVRPVANAILTDAGKPGKVGLRMPQIPLSQKTLFL